MHPHFFDEVENEVETLLGVDEASAVVDVRIVGTNVSSLVEQDTPTFGVWNGRTLNPTDPAFQAVPQARKRNRCYIWITAGLVGNVAGVVYIGSTQGQVQAGAAGTAVQLLAGGPPLVLESESAVWAAPDGTNSLRINTMDETYR